MVGRAGASSSAEVCGQGVGTLFATPRKWSSTAGGNPMTDNLLATGSDILIFQSEDGGTRIDVRLQDETVWLSQKLMAELFQTSVPNINQHLKNIFQEGELGENSVVKDFLITATDGKNYTTRFYNLEAIIAVGYRVRSHRGTQFRRWATERLREYLVKGFAMDDERLRDVRTPFGADYFDELLERIRDIRASEKRFYRKITDIYATSVDYDPNAPISQEFFATVQNKLHWAVTGHTAPELIARRADAAKPNMGLTAWKGPKVRKGDVTVAKNYLSQEELSDLNRVVTMYLDYAEDQAKRKKAMHMAQWADRLDAFLQFNEREVLSNRGKVQKAVADRLAKEEYDKFHERRLLEKAREAEAEDAAVGAEFDRVAKEIEGKKE